MIDKLCFITELDTPKFSYNWVEITGSMDDIPQLKKEVRKEKIESFVHNEPINEETKRKANKISISSQEIPSISTRLKSSMISIDDKYKGDNIIMDELVSMYLNESDISNNHMKSLLNLPKSDSLFFVKMSDADLSNKLKGYVLRMDSMLSMISRRNDNRMMMLNPCMERFISHNQMEINTIYSSHVPYNKIVLYNLPYNMDQGCGMFLFKYKDRYSIKRFGKDHFCMSISIFP